MLKNLLSSLNPQALKLIAAVLVVLLVAGLLLPTCRSHRPGELNRRQERRVLVSRDSALAAAHLDSARAVRLFRAGATARAEAARYDSLATYYAAHAQAIHTAVADSASLPRFFADFFAR